MDDKTRIREIDSILSALYPPTTALLFDSPFTLLVAAILAAQCTDERVNAVTRTLFQRFPGPEAFAKAEQETIEEAVHSTGFYRQKAKTLKEMSKKLVEDFGGKVPGSVGELIRLPGVGRKTANLVLGNAMGVPALFVDTHVSRLAARMGLTANKDPDKIEADLVKLLPQERWTGFSNVLTHHGRAICTARKPKCPVCPINALCPKIGV
ncbi:endonuclease III [bacterium]|nr:MAG: endonuclease III [bacterium]